MHFFFVHKKQQRNFLKQVNVIRRPLQTTFVWLYRVVDHIDVSKK